MIQNFAVMSEHALNRGADPPLIFSEKNISIVDHALQPKASAVAGKLNANAELILRPVIIQTSLRTGV